MIRFSVTKSVNIKLSDATLVKYRRFIKNNLWINENIYCTTYDDFKDIQRILSNIKQDVFECEVLDDEYFKKTIIFPRRLGVKFVNEYEKVEELNANLKKQELIVNTTITKKVDGYLDKQINLFDDMLTFKSDIQVVIIGACNKNLGEIICFCSAIRVLYSKLKEHCDTLKIDIYLQGSANKNYIKNKEIYESFPFIDEVKPLSIGIKELCNYDYYIDTSSFEQSIFYEELPYIDFFLKHFGIDYKEIESNKKYNELHLNDYKVNPKLQEKLEKLKEDGKLLLFHPYTADILRSIPTQSAKKILDKLTKYSEDYTVVTTLKIDGVKNEHFVDLSRYSKTFFDFVYIISQMDYVVSADTATYHISDAFFIPTVVLFNNEELIDRRIKYYNYVETLAIKTKTKSFSKFKFKDDLLYIKDYKAWDNLKISKVINLLEKIG